MTLSNLGFWTSWLCGSFALLCFAANGSRGVAELVRLGSLRVRTQKRVVWGPWWARFCVAWVVWDLLVHFCTPSTSVAWAVLSLGQAKPRLGKFRVGSAAVARTVTATTKPKKSNDCSALMCAGNPLWVSFAVVAALAAAACGSPGSSSSWSPPLQGKPVCNQSCPFQRAPEEQRRGFSHTTDPLHETRRVKP